MAVLISLFKTLLLYLNLVMLKYSIWLFKLIMTHTLRAIPLCPEVTSVGNSVIILFLFCALVFQQIAQITVTGKWQSSIFTSRFMQVGFFLCSFPCFGMRQWDTFYIDMWRHEGNFDFTCLCKDLLSNFFAAFKTTAVFVVGIYNCIY